MRIDHGLWVEEGLDISLLLRATDGALASESNRSRRRSLKQLGQFALACSAAHSLAQKISPAVVPKDLVVPALGAILALCDRIDAEPEPTFLEENLKDLGLNILTQAEQDGLIDSAPPTANSG